MIFASFSLAFLIVAKGKARFSVESLGWCLVHALNLNPVLVLVLVVDV